MNKQELIQKWTEKREELEKLLLHSSDLSDQRYSEIWEESKAVKAFLSDLEALTEPIVEALQKKQVRISSYPYQMLAYPEGDFELLHTVTGQRTISDYRGPDQALAVKYLLGEEG